MAVYQSGTMPVIRKKSMKFMALGTLVGVAGPERHAKRLKSWNKIPSKAETDIYYHENGPWKGTYEFDFRWFEVETNA